MAGFLSRRRSLHVPITLSVVLMASNVALMVFWIITLAQMYWWGALAWGTVLFALILVGLVVYLVLTIKEVRLNQRQTNFVDSVTHELKSPIASLRLYTETMLLRDVDEVQRKSFLEIMADDINRLDVLITQLLEVGRLDAIASEAMDEEVEAEPLLRSCAVAACTNNKRSLDAIKLDIEPAILRGSRLALEMVFRNLIDNALKYAGEVPLVEVDVRTSGAERVVARVADNGVGVPVDLRRKIFQLFFRGGSELERTRSGTGLGLYIVHTLVRQMKGRISVHGRGKLPGTVFEVELPGRALACEF